jgi:hypothetical protein
LTFHDVETAFSGRAGVAGSTAWARIPNIVLQPIATMPILNVICAALVNPTFCSWR